MQMKTIALLALFFAVGISLSAQEDRLNDFYVTKQRDTVFGTYIYGIKYDAFKNLKGENRLFDRIAHEAFVVGEVCYFIYPQHDFSSVVEVWDIVCLADEWRGT